MRFKYACFISYRNGDRTRDKAYIFQLTKQLREDLLDQLELLLEPEVGGVFLDTVGLQGGNRLDPTIAQALCQSVCMLCVWTPIYFSKEHPYCAREYHAMESLEQTRFELLGSPENEQQGLIIPLTLRLSKRFPKNINRLYINFEKFLLPRQEGLTRDSEYYDVIRGIAERIAERYWELSQIPDEQLTLLNTVKLPQEDDEDFVTWLNSILG